MSAGTALAIRARIEKSHADPAITKGNKKAALPGGSI